MIPLINIVFLLLIFFVVAGTIRPFEIIQIDPPEMSDTEYMPENAIVILLGRHDALLVNEEPVLLADLGAHLEMITAERRGKIPVTLKMEADLPARSMIRIFEQLVIAGVSDIALVTKEKLED